MQLYLYKVIHISVYMDYNSIHTVCFHMTFLYIFIVTKFADLNIRNQLKLWRAISLRL